MEVIWIARPSPAGSRMLRGLREKASEDIARSVNNSRGCGRSRYSFIGTEGET
jgi:hypothetical protein